MISTIALGGFLARCMGACVVLSAREYKTSDAIRTLIDPHGVHRRRFVKQDFRKGDPERNSVISPPAHRREECLARVPLCRR